MRKKLFVLILILMVSNTYLFSQIHVADSLKKLLQTHPSNDTIRINLLNELARELRRNKPKQADSVINLSLALSEQLNYKRGKGFALIIKAVRCYDQSDYPSAYKTFDEAQPILESINDKKNLAYIITKGHNGEIKVETKEGEGAEFIITLANI